MISVAEEELVNRRRLVNWKILLMEQGNWDLLFSQFQLPCRVAEESCWTGCWLVIPPRWNQPQRRWCQSGVQCLSFCRVSHLCENVLTQIEYWYPHYIWSQKCYCRIASWLWSSWDCRLENEEGEVFLKVISTTYEKTESHIPCICETTDWEWEMSTFQGKLKIVFHVWFCCFFFNVILEEFSILSTGSFCVEADNI